MFQKFLQESLKKTRRASLGVNSKFPLHRHVFPMIHPRLPSREANCQEERKNNTAYRISSHIYSMISSRTPPEISPGTPSWISAGAPLGTTSGIPPRASWKISQWIPSVIILRILWGISSGALCSLSVNSAVFFRIFFLDSFRDFPGILRDFSWGCWRILSCNWLRFF